MAKRHASQSARARTDIKCCLKNGAPRRCTGRPALCSTSGTIRKVERMSHLLSIFSERNRHQTRRTLRASNKDMTAAATSPVRAELIGDDICSALGITAQSSSPLLALCWKLIEAGHDPDAPLHAYRGNTLALKVRSIGEGAKLTVEANRIGKPVFRRRRDRAESNGAAPPVASTAPAKHQPPLRSRHRGGLTCRQTGSLPQFCSLETRGSEQ